jgi:hypothetical protein
MRVMERTGLMQNFIEPGGRNIANGARVRVHEHFQTRLYLSELQRYSS